MCNNGAAFVLKFTQVANKCVDVKLNVAPTQAFAGDPHLNSGPSLPRSQWGPQDRVPLYLTFVKFSQKCLRFFRASNSLQVRRTE